MVLVNLILRKIPSYFDNYFYIILWNFGVASLLDKSSSLAAALGVTKLISILLLI
jgi:hypothetical protein